MAGETDRHGIELQIQSVLDNIDDPVFFEEISPEQLYGLVSPLISEAVGILKLIPQLKEKVFENWFDPSYLAKPLFTININEQNQFQVSYSRGDRYIKNNKDEDFVLIKNGEETINLHTYHLLNHKVKGQVLYSDNTSRPGRKRYIDNVTAIEHAHRLINELKTAI